MSRPLCLLCEGPRDVQRRLVLGVPLDVCRWCWEKHGPARIPTRLGDVLGGAR